MTPGGVAMLRVLWDRARANLIAAQRAEAEARSRLNVAEYELTRGARTDPRVETEELHDEQADAVRLRGGPRSPSTFEAQAAAAKRSPSGTIQAVRPEEADTDPAPPIRSSDR